MPYSSNYAHVRKMFWDGTETIKNSPKPKLYKLDEEGIRHALFRSLKDYTPRTDKKQEEEPTAKVTDMLDALLKNNYVQYFLDYFNLLPTSVAFPCPKNRSEYDEWHEKMCDNFISIITSSKIRSSVSYGKAQKIVNMTMKTIYCLEGAEIYANKGYFDYCHMPLDSYILDWFWENVAEGFLNKEGRKKVFFKYNMVSWSSIKKTTSKNKGGKDIAPYKDYVKHTRDFFSSSPPQYIGLTPFKAEFYIWPEIQWENTAKSLANQDLLRKLLLNSGVTVNNPTITNLCNELTTQLADMSKYY